MNEPELNYSKLGFVAVVAAVGRMVVFDGVVVVVAVDYATAVANVERCDVLAGVFVAVVALAAAGDDACGLEEQRHLNSLPERYLAEQRIGYSSAVDSTMFEYLIGVEVAVVVAAELAAEILYFELAAVAAAAVTFAVVAVGTYCLLAILAGRRLPLLLLVEE